MRAQTVRKPINPFFPHFSFSSKNSNESIGVEVRVDGTLSVIDFNFTAPQSVWTPKLRRSDPKRMDYPFLPADASSSDNSHYLTYGKTDREKISLLASNSEVRRVLEAASLQGDGLFPLRERSGNETDLGGGKLILSRQLRRTPGQEIHCYGRRWSYGRSLTTRTQRVFPLRCSNWALSNPSGKTMLFSFQWNRTRHSRRHFKRSEPPPPQLEIFKRKIPMLGQALAYYSDGKPFLTRRVWAKESFIPFPHSRLPHGLP